MNISQFMTKKLQDFCITLFQPAHYGRFMDSAARIFLADLRFTLKPSSQWRTFVLDKPGYLAELKIFDVIVEEKQLFMVVEA
jgi:hypothetical protein